MAFFIIRHQPPHASFHIISPTTTPSSRSCSIVALDLRCACVAAFIQSFKKTPILCIVHHNSLTIHNATTATNLRYPRQSNSWKKSCICHAYTYILSNITASMRLHSDFSKFQAFPRDPPGRSSITQQKYYFIQQLSGFLKHPFSSLYIRARKRSQTHFRPPVPKHTPHIRQNPPN